KAVDAVYFNGANSETTWLVCGTARRRNNLVNGFLYLKIADFSERLLVSPRLPDTCMWQSDEELGRYEAEGLKLTPVVPMKKWKIEYQGAMRFENDLSQEMKVKLEAFWTTDLPYYNFATDMDPRPVARAMAKELWSREHFQNLKKYVSTVMYHQTHYEHFGTLEGKVQIDDKTFPLSVDCMRDHSFGDQRNWKNFHRYVMHFVHLENGDRITVGLICMPITFSWLEVGFVTKSKKAQNIPITFVDFDLFQHGEQGNPPTDYALQFRTDENIYTMKVRVVANPEFYIGQESECRIVEQLCHFEVNGLKGWGAAEWQYRHYGGLPK
ncbi:AAEL008264-PA, partial [Aedes aegypti]